MRSTKELDAWEENTGRVREAVINHWRATHGWPTVKAMSIKLGLSQRLIRDLVEADDNMDLLVAIQTAGGVADLKKSDWMIEVYDAA